MEPRVVSIDAATVDARPDAIGELFAGRLTAITVRAALAPELLARAVARLDAGEVTLPRVQVPVFKGYLLGMPLVAATGLDSYLDSADQFRAGSRQLLEGLDLERHLGGLLARMAGGRAVSVPEHRGRPYLPAGFRVLLDGDALPFHYENSTFGNPRMEALAPTLDRATLMSFYLPVTLPERGGELRIYAADSRGEGSRAVERLGGNDAARAWFEAGGFETLSPEVGDLLLFDGGRQYHEITKVLRGPRWTLGGFLALSADRRVVFFWS